MSELHRVYLSLGSNIQPEVHLPKAIKLLRQYGQVAAVSSAWESQSVGTEGPNYLNASVLFLTQLSISNVKEHVIQPIETALERKRSEEKFAPRTIDIDIVMYDGKPHKLHYWDYAFVLLPMSELDPDLLHPITNEKMSIAAERIRHQVWIVARPEIID